MKKRAMLTYALSADSWTVGSRQVSCSKRGPRSRCPVVCSRLQKLQKLHTAIIKKHNLALIMEVWQYNTQKITSSLIKNNGLSKWQKDCKNGSLIRLVHSSLIKEEQDSKEGTNNFHIT
jgi:hypothetical protein